jgi:transposase
MADLFWFSEAQWARIEPLLPKNTRGLKRVDDRRVLSGIVHVLKTGCRWCDLPADYGPKKTIYNRFVRWAERGIWEDVFAALAGRGEDPDALMIDATIVKAHRSAGGAKGGLQPMVLVAARAAGQPRSTPSPTKRAARLYSP